jgi:hypothetical protein
MEMGFVMLDILMLKPCQAHFAERERMMLHKWSHVRGAAGLALT